MDGGTTFHFVDAPIENVLEQAFDAAGGADVRLGGGASTVRQYVQAGLVDDLHVPIVPVLLGRGERLFDDLVDIAARYQCIEFVPSPSVAHVRLAKVTDV
jgi:dihydrofolate reductase